MRHQVGVRRKVKVSQTKKKTVRRTKSLKAQKALKPVMAQEVLKPVMAQEAPFNYSASFNAVTEKTTQTPLLHNFRLPSGLDEYLDKIKDDREKEKSESAATIEKLKDLTSSD